MLFGKHVMQVQNGTRKGGREEGMDVNSAVETIER